MLEHKDLMSTNLPGYLIAKKIIRSRLDFAIRLVISMIVPIYPLRKGIQPKASQTLKNKLIDLIVWSEVFKEVQTLVEMGHDQRQYTGD